VCSDERFGENPKGWPTQRMALKEEGQLRWACSHHTHRSSFLFVRLRTLRVVPTAVHM